jgi:glycosyltransferase involved in cell wall biosynthesis
MSEARAPLVSVVIPVKDGLPYIREALGSLWKQTFQDFEVLVIDDGSTDGTPQWVASLKHPKIRLLEAVGAGVFAATLTGYRMARGNLIAHLDADDVSLPQRLEAQVLFLDQNPNVAAVGTQVRFLVDGVQVPAFSYPSDPGEVLKVFQRGRPGVCNGSVVLRCGAARSVTPRVFGPGGDVDFYLRLAGHAAIANLRGIHYLVRLHEGSLSFSHVRAQLCGIAFGVAADRARRREEPEPEFEAFVTAWKKRGIWARLATELRVQHQRAYRRSVICRARGRRLSRFAWLAAAAALWPQAVGYQLWRRLAAVLS